MTASVSVDQSSNGAGADNALPLQRVTANGVELAYFERRPEGVEQPPLVICLHGFPDTAHSFIDTLDVLAGAGFRAVAPFLRGYYPSAQALDGDYSIPAVARDILALIDTLYEGEGEAKASVVGHDWGGLAAATAANIAPQKIDKLTVMAVPHVASTVMTFAQLKKSWYVLFFQLPWLPERVVAKDHFAFIDRLYSDWSPSWAADGYDLTPVKQSLSIAGGLPAALGYYRAMVRGSKAADRAIMQQPCSVPALWIAGVEDGSVGIDQFSVIEKAFNSDFELLTVEGAGHFVHREKPQQVHDKIISFLKINT